jgi:exopolysaccharide production protein ExoZ
MISNLQFLRAFASINVVYFNIFKGNASYSIYLVQILTVPGFYKFITYLNIETNDNMLSLLCLVFSVAFGCFTHSFIEKKLKFNIKIVNRVYS